MNGILRGIENERRLDKPPKRVSWDDVTNVKDKGSQNAQHPQTN